MDFLAEGEPATLLSSNGAANPRVFIGRQEELKAIRERLNDHGKLMLINAEGGIGKTTLAAKYWNESLYDYKHNAWLFCDNGIVNALKELAPKLNVDLAGMNETQQIAALKQALSQVHDDFLLVLDNANDDDDIRVFKQEFEGFHWLVLITSRCRGVLDESMEMPITHLPPPLAKALFERNYKEESKEFDALLNRLLLALNYHTLCIELFSKNMKELSERGDTLANFVNRLETEGLFLGNRSFKIITDYTSNLKIDAKNSDEILDRFYNFAKLTEQKRYWLVNMAMLPAEEYNFVFLCRLFNQDPITFDFLHSLARKGWLKKNDKSFKINPVIQSIAIKKNEQTLGTDAQALLNSLNYILKADAYNLLNIKLSEAEDFAKLIFQVNKSLEKYPSKNIANLNFNAGIYFNNVGDLISNQYCFENYGKIYQKLLIEEPENLSYKNGLAISYEKLGGIYEQTGDWKNALLNYQKYNRLQSENIKASPETLEYKNGLAISYLKMGDIYEPKGDLENALLNYQEQLKIFKEIYESSQKNPSYKNGLAISYSRLGGIYEQRGDLRNALFNYQEDFRITKEIYESSPENLSYKNGLAISYGKLADVFMAENKIEDALKNNLLCLAMYKEIVIATQGKIIDFTFNFSWVCWKVSNIVKQYALYQTIDKATLKQISLEGYQAIKPLAEQGLLQENQKWLFNELSYATWYDF